MIRRISIVLLVAFITMGASCPGMSEDPVVSKIQTATVTCASIEAVIRILTPMKGRGQLSSTAIAEADLLIAGVTPICGEVATSGDYFDIEALNKALRALEKLERGAT